MSDTFKNFCLEISGSTHISETHIESAKKYFLSCFSENSLQTLLDSYNKLGIEKLLDSELGDDCRSLLYFLIVGKSSGKFELNSVTSPTAAEDHYQALLWEMVEAHAPGLTGGYFGHWHYSAE